jgi:hypothetical protein
LIIGWFMLGLAPLAVSGTGCNILDGSATNIEQRLVLGHHQSGTRQEHALTGQVFGFERLNGIESFPSG